MKDKHIRMYMEQAKSIAEGDQHSCLSRHIGVVIAKNDAPGGRVISTGYNGPASKLPSPDSREHLEAVVWDQLTDQERECTPHAGCKDEFLDEYSGCGKCPRKIVGAKSGDRLQLCGCCHAEENAIMRASEPLAGCWMFCWCGIPCAECTRKIINVNISNIVVISWGDFIYNPHSIWMLKKAGVKWQVRDPETLDVIDD